MQKYHPATPKRQPRTTFELTHLWRVWASKPWDEIKREVEEEFDTWTDDKEELKRLVERARDNHSQSRKRADEHDARRDQLWRRIYGVPHPDL